MVNTPKDYHAGFYNKQFKELIEFFNQIEKDMEYPNCEGNADKTRVLNKALDDLIRWGII